MTPEEIISLLHELEMTQEQLAHQIGVTVSTVNRWCNGKAKPHAVFVRAMRELKEKR